MPIRFAEWGADLIVMPMMVLGTCVALMAFFLGPVNERLRRVTGRILGLGFKENLT